MCASAGVAVGVTAWEGGGVCVILMPSLLLLRAAHNQPSCSTCLTTHCDQVRREVEELLHGDLAALLADPPRPGSGPAGTRRSPVPELPADMRQVSMVGLGGGGAHLLERAATFPLLSSPQVLADLRSREQRLQHEIRSKTEELAMQAQLVAPKLPADLAARARQLESRVAELRAQAREAEARWERDGSGAQVCD